MFRKKTGKVFSYYKTFHFYKTPKELFCYLDDKDKMGRVKDKKILKLDLKYFWKKFSSLITARLSDLGGMFVQGVNVCEPAREMLWTRRKSCLYSGGVSFSQYKLYGVTHPHNMKQVPFPTQIPLLFHLLNSTVCQKNQNLVYFIFFTMKSI